jgi:hypothetical protein
LNSFGFAEKSGKIEFSLLSFYSCQSGLYRISFPLSNVDPKVFVYISRFGFGFGFSGTISASSVSFFFCLLVLFVQDLFCKCFFSDVWEPCSTYFEKLFFFFSSIFRVIFSHRKTFSELKWGKEAKLKKHIYGQNEEIPPPDLTLGLSFSIYFSDKVCFLWHVNISVKKYVFQLYSLSG